MRKWLSRRGASLLIGAGAAMILIFALYEGMNYPWRVLFAQWGWITLSEEMPDPPPLGEQASPGGEESAGAAGTQSALPGRPSVELVWMGTLKLPSIQVSENIVEGDGEELYYAVGHTPGTALPGQEGNCFLSGHRNLIYMRPFRYLDKMAAGDRAYVSDGENTYTYEVFEIFECGPDDTWVMNPVKGETHVLTLMTCTPVLNPVNRLIVRARLVGGEAPAAEAS